jgi:GST-like protein
VTIELYTWGTPNGRKVSIALEELNLAYNVHPVDIGKGAQFDPDFLKISPNNKIPAILDPEGPEGEAVALFESGAILLYLAEKTGRLMPESAAGRMSALQWLMWQMGGFGPMAGQAHHFLRFAKEEVPYAKARYRNETGRLYGVLDRRLGEARFVAGESYSMADIAIYPWTARHPWQQIDLAAYPNVLRWYEEVGSRPAVVRGMAVPA